MGFWLFMLIMDLLIPAIMIGFGALFIKTPPEKINYLFGYRTSMSMKNEDTWAFAHKQCGKVWLRVGMCLLIISVILLCFMPERDVSTVGTVGGAICALQTVCLVASIVPTEIALNKTFDKNGNRK